MEFNKQYTEGKSFESFKEAECSSRHGFVIDKEAKVKYSEWADLNICESLTLRQLFKLKTGGKIQATWTKAVWGFRNNASTNTDNNKISYQLFENSSCC